MIRKLPLLGFVLINLNCIGSVSAAVQTWYVQPYSLIADQYGVADGSSYADAWNGLGDVEWDGTGDSGVGPGDTLFVCGMHPDVDVSPDNNGNVINHTQLKVGASGAEGSPITIRFDCQDDLDEPDPGLIVRVSRQRSFDVNDLQNGWVETAANSGIYTSGFFTPSPLYTHLEYIPVSETMNRLKKAEGTPATHPSHWEDAGTAFYDTDTKTYYYKPTDVSNRSFIYQAAELDGISIDNKHHIEIIGSPALDKTSSVADREYHLMADGMNVRNGSTNIVISNLFVKYAATAGIRINDVFVEKEGCDNIEVRDSRIEWSHSGIYNSNSPATQCNNLWIHGNYLSNLDQDEYWTINPDRHGIQIESGNNHIIEYNHITNVGTHGIAFDAKTWNPGDKTKQNNNIVRYNFVKGVGTKSHPQLISETAFHLEGTHNGYDPNTQKNNIVHNNVFSGAERAGVFIAVTGKPDEGFTWAFYNNTIVDNKIGVSFQDSADDPDNVTQWEIGFVFKNNIVSHSGDPSTYGQLLEHAYLPGTNFDWSGIDMDHSLYFDDADDNFGWKGEVYDFANWKINSAQDANSQVADPRYQNLSGTLSTAADFGLQPDSPAAGAAAVVPVVLTAKDSRDMLGNLVYDSPDLGAMQSLPPYVMGNNLYSGFSENADRIKDQVRVYGDGRYRDQQVTGSSVDYQADLNVFPESSYGQTEYSSDDGSTWLEIDISAWETNHKVWTVTREVGTSSGNVRYFVGDLVAGQDYYICLDGDYWITRTAYGDGEFTFARQQNQGVTMNYEVVLASEAGNIGGCIQQALYTSTAANDGWILESKENSDVGSNNPNLTDSSSPVLIIGDDHKNRQYRLVVSFEGLAVPVNASIASARLELTRNTVSGVDPHTLFAPAWIDLSFNGFGGSLSLVGADFQAPADVDHVGQLTDNGVIATADINPSVASTISGASSVQLRIAFEVDDNNDQSPDFVEYFSGDSLEGGYHPRLIIDYALP